MPQARMPHMDSDAFYPRKIWLEEETYQQLKSYIKLLDLPNTLIHDIINASLYNLLMAITEQIHIAAKNKTAVSIAPIHAFIIRTNPYSHFHIREENFTDFMEKIEGLMTETERLNIKNDFPESGSGTVH